MKLAILIPIFLISHVLFSQQFDYITHAKHNGSVTYLDLAFLDDQTILVSGLYRDSNIGLLWKYDLDGNVLDSVIVDKHEKQPGFLIENRGDSILWFGRDIQGDSVYLSIRCFDMNLSPMWEKYYPLEMRPIIKKYRAVQFKNRNYIFMSTTGGLKYFKFDRNFNLLDSYLDSFSTLDAEPHTFTDSGFVFMRGYQKMYVDTSFNVTYEQAYPYSDSIGRAFFGDFIMTPNNDYWHTGRQGEDRLYSTIHYSEDFLNIKGYPFFGSYGDHSAFGRLNSIACNIDTTVIYASGTLVDKYPYPVPFGSDSAYPFFVARMQGDSLLWYNYYTDGHYYAPINMEVGPDNALYMACTRYDVANQPSYSESVIMRISPEGDLPVGMHEQPNFKQQPKVYPNPGSNSLHIKLPEPGQASVLMYNMQGAIVKSATFYSEISLLTHDLPAGIYMYRITTTMGKTFSGKWVKQ